MREQGMRILSSVLVGWLCVSCGGPVEEVRRTDAEDEVFFLPSAPRAIASPVVSEVELRRAVEELLPSVAVGATLAELRRVLADPRFHGRRVEELHIVRASWGSGPSNLEEITRGYRDWCNRAKQSECLARTLTDSDVYGIAFDVALGSRWDGFVKEVKSTIDPATIRVVLLASMVLFMATLAAPELMSKIPAAAATVILTAYIGAQAVCDLIFGWIRMVGELDAATSFDQVRAAGQRYGEKIGVQTARILILLATAAIAEGGIVARLMKLPRAAEASAAMATETGGVGLEVVGQVEGVRVSASGVAIAMVSQGSSPGSSSSESDPRAFTANNFRKNLGQLTGGTPDGADAHHVFPQKYAERFRKVGINIHDPRYGAWWETKAHQVASYEYNEKWRRFLQKNDPASAEQILQFGRKLSAEYGLRVGF